MNVKCVKISSLAALPAVKYIKEWSSMHEPLKNRTYLGKKLFFSFLGADFLALKSSHSCEKQPVLGLVDIFKAFGRVLHAGLLHKLES